MPTKLGVKRLQIELANLTKDPVFGIVATPKPSNIFEWHFIIAGPKDTPYFGGQYHGVLKFPQNYPFAGPEIQMFTPSGRFETNTPICTSMSNFHPESWSTTWSVSSILVGLVSFMAEESHGVGSMSASDAERRKLAAQSIHFNQKNPVFNQLFASPT
ncbi:putative ubiquitin-conjugating enzyme e2 j2 [Monocercomonoides exilis]|uniref:putative ubiquitin-conjugating enzyme e2 j2 n=1 Tax=Monocercomonoides exilis TaxID=2049356 RepID=UPI003559E322|nr:putative ubiquitin-conjugating enzyme e2 j2 [Monocercomonoides exilis]